MRTPSDLQQFIQDRLDWLDKSTVNINADFVEEDFPEGWFQPYLPVTTGDDGTLPIRVAVSKHLPAIRAIIVGYGLPTRVECLEQCRDLSSREERYTSEIEQILREELETLERFLAITSPPSETEIADSDSAPIVDAKNKAGQSKINLEIEDPLVAKVINRTKNGTALQTAAKEVAAGTDVTWGALKKRVQRLLQETEK